jgi:hypothetical protein
MVSLPRYQSHKIVEAAPIIAYERTEPCAVWVRIDEAQTEKIGVPADFFARAIPGVGDYFVRYEDGYVSWSPKQAFEDGYTRDTFDGPRSG